MSPSSVAVADKHMLRVGAQGTYYHGTSATRLRGILKEGLIPAGTRGLGLQYAEEWKAPGRRSEKTYGGVYLTKDINTAAEYASQASDYSENNVIVVARIETRTQGTLVDEDHIHGILTDALSIDYDFRMWGSGSPFKSKIEPLLVRDPEHGMTLPVRAYPEVVQIIQQANIDYLTLAVLNHLHTHFPNTRIDWQRNAVAVETAVETLIHRWLYHLLESGFVGHYEDAPRPTELKGTYQKLKQATDYLLKLLPRSTEKSDAEHTNIRFSGTLTYKGKNRITGVVEMRHHYFEKEDVEIMDFRVWYGGVAPSRDLIDQLGSSYQLGSNPGGYCVTTPSGEVLESTLSTTGWELYSRL